MNADLSELIWRSIALIGALIVLPTAYLWILWRLSTQRISRAPTFELFVGFGSIGGWLLFFVLVGSGPLVILPVAAFQFFVAFPVSLLCMFRLLRRPIVTRYEALAGWLLAAGALIPFLVIVLSFVLAQVRR
jgi:hypothetical protein